MIRPKEFLSATIILCNTLAITTIPIGVHDRSMTYEVQIHITIALNDFIMFSLLLLRCVIRLKESLSTAATLHNAFVTIATLISTCNRSMFYRVQIHFTIAWFITALACN